MSGQSAQDGRGTTPEQILAGGLTLGLMTAEAPPVATAIVVGAVAVAGAKAIYDETQRTHVTYKLTGPRGKIYVGRASGFETPEQV